MKINSDVLLTIIGKKDVELFAVQSQFTELKKENEELKNQIKELTSDGNSAD